MAVDQPANEIAQTIQAVIDAQGLDNISTSIVDVRVLIEGTGGVNGTGAVDLITIQDEVGNQLQSNQANGRTELTIFIGSGFDYGDAPHRTYHWTSKADLDMPSIQPSRWDRWFRPTPTARCPMRMMTTE